MCLGGSPCSPLVYSVSVLWEQIFSASAGLNDLSSVSLLEVSDDLLYAGGQIQPGGLCQLEVSSLTFTVHRSLCVGVCLLD